jgi:hypothetical protein
VVFDSEDQVMTDTFIGELPSELQSVRNLEAAGDRNATFRAISTYVTANPDEVNGHLLHSYILTRHFQHDTALAALQKAIIVAGGAKAFRSALGKEVVLIFSNCHGKIIRSTFMARPEMTERFFFVGLYNMSPRNFTQEVADIADIAIFQSMSWNDNIDQEFTNRFAPSMKIIRFPAATMLSFWPYYVQAPAKKDESGRALYRYAYGDRFIDSRVREGKEKETITFEYLDLDLPSAVQIERVMEAESQKEFTKEAHADVKIRAYIEANFRSAPMFFTPNHPTRRVMNIQALQIAQHLGVTLKPETLLTEEYAETSNTHHPIHPTTIDYLGLEYRTPWDTFKLSRAGNVTFEQFIPLYIAGTV